MIAGMTYYQIAADFLLYAFLGWCVEVIYHAVRHGKIINRGFLNGPVCPVYGFGVVGVFAFTKAVLPAMGVLSAGSGGSAGSWQELLVLFVAGMILTTLIELIAGWLLDVCFHARWWDYSRVPLNFHGYICLPFSIIWGLAVVFVVQVVQPAMESEKGIHIPEQYGWPILAVLYAIFIADCIVTVMTVAGLNRRLAELDHISQQMRIVSDGLSQKLGSDSITAQQKISEQRVQAHLAGAELQERAQEKLRIRREELEAQIVSHKVFGSGRLLRAFPTMKHEEHDGVVRSLREKIRK